MANHSLTLKDNQRVGLSAVAKDADGLPTNEPIYWNFAGNAVVTLSSYGPAPSINVDAVGPTAHGTCTVTAHTADNQFQDSIEITVVGPTTQVQMTVGSPYLKS